MTKYLLIALLIVSASAQSRRRDMLGSGGSSSSGIAVPVALTATSNGSNTGFSSASFTIPAGASAVVVLLSWNWGSGGAANTVTDVTTSCPSTGNTYTRQPYMPIDNFNTNAAQDAWVALNPTCTGPGAVVTWNPSPNASSTSMQVYVVTGLTGSAAYDGNGVFQGGGGTFTGYTCSGTSCVTGGTNTPSR